MQMAGNAIRAIGSLLGDSWIDPYSPGNGVGQDASAFGFERGFDISAKTSGLYQLLRTAHYESQSGQINRAEFLDKLSMALGFDLVPASGTQNAVGLEFTVSHFDSLGDQVVPFVQVEEGKRIDRSHDNERAPQTELQEFLNKSDRTWGLVTNGETLRVLRATARFGSKRYLDFDLTAMFEAGLEDEFEALFRLAHRSRFPISIETAQDCLLEKWFIASEQDAERVRGGLRDGVHEAVEILGRSFLSEESNKNIRKHLESGELSGTDFYREILTVIYRILFLAISESRDLLKAPNGSNSAYNIYIKHYGIEQLRVRALHGAEAGDGGDIWDGFVRLSESLRDEDAVKALGISALGGSLFEIDSCQYLEASICDNAALLEAVRLTTTFPSREGGFDRLVNFEAMNVEELGSVYESLLEFRPVVDLNSRYFQLESGSTRKETGSYYTPESLVNQLIQTALDPVLKERLESADTPEAKARAILKMRVIDPAAGSGHFLLAAARRMGAQLASVRTGGSEPTSDETRIAVRDVIRRCIYAADRNPLAIDLCKVALWIESQSPGLPLSFIDAHVVLGDSLVGVFDLNILKDGIPDGAFKPVTGDDKAFVRKASDLNRTERKARGIQPQLGDEPIETQNLEIAQTFESVVETDATSLEDLRTKRGALKSLRNSLKFSTLKTASDVWTAAFYTRFNNSERPFTSGDVRRAIIGSPVPVDNLSIRPLHWPLEFPEAMVDGGFDVVIGNPPWERIKLQEKEFFAGRDHAIETAKTAASRRKLIAELEEKNRSLFREYEDVRFLSESQGRFLRGSGRSPLGSKGDINTYAIFTELFDRLVRKGGRAGFIVPSGLATDSTTKGLFGHLVSSGRLSSLFDFENRNRIFPAVHSSMKFSLVTLCDSTDDRRPVNFAFFLRGVEELSDSSKIFNLSPADFKLFNPNTLTCPIFRSKRDAEITKKIFRSAPVLSLDHPALGENSWGVEFSSMFHMTNDSGKFQTIDQLRLTRGFTQTVDRIITDKGEFVPLLEGKMIDLYNHRSASVVTTDNVMRPGQPIESSYDQLIDEKYSTMPQYWISTSELEGLPDEGSVVIKSITSPTNARTVIASAVPQSGVANSLVLLEATNAPTKYKYVLLSVLNSMVFDYTARQKVGGVTLNFFLLRQFPCPEMDIFMRPSKFTAGQPLASWLLNRVLKLTYTSENLSKFALKLDYSGPPFRWDESWRSELRAEIDAAIFHLYDLDREDVDYILDTFPIVERKDLSEFGEYRTKRMILEKYDEFT
jgi:hypothetical protein